MSKVRYIVSHTNGSEITVDIDFSFIVDRGDFGYCTMEEAIKEMVDFWVGSEMRVKNNGGDYTKTFLLQLCRKIALSGLADQGNNIVLKLFENEEGYYRLDGSAGITLVDCEGPHMADPNLFDIDSYSNPGKIKV